MRSYTAPPHLAVGLLYNDGDNVRNGLHAPFQAQGLRRHGLREDWGNKLSFVLALARLEQNIGVLLRKM